MNRRNLISGGLASIGAGLVGLVLPKKSRGDFQLFQGMGWVETKKKTLEPKDHKLVIEYWFLKNIKTGTADIEIRTISHQDSFTKIGEIIRTQYPYEDWKYNAVLKRFLLIKKGDSNYQKNFENNFTY